MISPKRLTGTSRSKRLACCAAILLVGCAPMAPDEARNDAQRVQAVIADPVRTDQDRNLDAARHPAQFLPFTQVKPGMRVLDVATGGGYTSQLLAVAVGPNGTVWAQAQQPGANITRRLAEHPQANLILVARPFDNPVPDGIPPLDLVTLVNNYHDITYLPVDRAKMNQRIYAALKPGGRFVVIDHSAKAGTGISAGKTLHRVDQTVVVNEVTQAGFVLDAEGDFLRNPADTREESSNEPKVPTDKFALRFIKPR